MVHLQLRQVHCAVLYVAATTAALLCVVGAAAGTPEEAASGLRSVCSEGMLRGWGLAGCIPDLLTGVLQRVPDLLTGVSQRVSEGSGATMVTVYRPWLRMSLA